jgi:hypothetical protein
VKTCSLVVFLFSFYFAGAQNYRQIDNRSAVIEASRPDELARKLVAPYKTDTEKFRAIFSWITNHISYNLQRSARNGKLHFAEINADTTWDSKPLDERVAYQVIKNRKAVCDGYARLLKTLCDYAGLSCNVISGYAKTGGRTDRNFCTNHTWNAVYLDSVWKLVDVTWASGYVSTGTDEFVKKYDDLYFLLSPEEFSKNHYPEDPQWTLLERPPEMKEYKNRPFLLKAFIKNRIVDYTPALGTFTVSPGDTIEIKLTTSDLSNGAKGTASLPHLSTSSVVFLQPVYTSPAKEILYRYHVTPGVEWLNVLYGDDIVIRYCVKMKD